MLSTLAPAADDAFDLKPSMTMSLWCTCYSITIIIFRVVGRWTRTKTVFLEDIIMSLSVLILIARISLVPHILHDGTNNVDLSTITELDIQRREFGSKIVLITRILYAMYLWVVKLSVGIYLTRLIDQFWAAKAMLSNSSGGRIIKTFLSNYCNSMFYISLVVSFVGVCLSELIECRPFSHYWQVAPDPGPACRQAYGQLFTMGAFNILTDLILIALPLPLIIEAKLARKVKLESLLLMLFPLVNICFTTYRLPSTVSSDHLGSQRYRTFMASLDILLSTASANALVVTSFLQGRGFKKTTTYKHPELEGQQEDETALQQHQHHHGEDDVELKSLGHINTTAGLRLSARSSLGDRHSQAIRKRWGSDEDLMRDDFGVGESTPPTLVPKRMSSQIIFDEGDALPVADGCSERSTTRLSPWPLAETSISADKTAIHAMAEIGDGSGDIAMPRQARRASAVKGIVVETTWHVDVSRSS